MNKASRLILLFGGPTKLSAALGIDVSAVSRWPVREKKVPVHHNPAIIEAARSLGIPVDKVEACLQPYVCPSCDRPMPAGFKLKPRVRGV